MLRLACASLLMALAALAGAQPIAPNGLNTVATPGVGSWSITGGTPRTGNLFHSFSAFSVPAASTVTFAGPDPVQHVISRVTGGTPSTIEGSLRTAFPGAAPDFWLINPGGVIFRQGASLPTAGSFHASTANYLRLQDGVLFRATNVPLNDASTLTSAPPVAFGFLANTPAQAISVEPLANLTVANGATLSLVGGDISVNGATLNAPAGRVNIASTGGASAREVAFDSASITQPAGGGGTITISGNSQILANSVTGTAPAGAVYIRGGVLTVEGGATLPDYAAIKSVNREAGTGGGVHIAVDGDVTIRRALVFSDSEGPGTAGDLTISAGRLLISESTAITSDATRDGPAGSVRVTAGEVQVGSDARIASNAFQAGAAGTVDLRATRISLSDGGRITSDTAGSGAGGSISVGSSATQLIELANGSISASTSADGAGGHIALAARTVRLSDGAAIRAESTGTAQGGNITVTAAGGTITLDRSEISVNNRNTGLAGNIALSGARIDVTDDPLDPSGADSRGIRSIASGTESGGGISLTATQINVSRLGSIRADALASGAGGSIAVNGGAVRVFESGRISANTSDAQGGSIAVTGGTIRVDTLGRVSADSDGFGAAGSVTLSASGSIAVSGGGNVTSNGSGFAPAGTILVQAPSITVSGIDSKITSNGANGADAGSVTVGSLAGPYATGSITVSAAGLISSDTNGSGLSGGVNLRASTVRVTGDQSQVRATSTLNGNAGNVDIVATSALYVENGGMITTSAVTNDGGNINITAGDLVFLRHGQITTQVASGGGAGGNIHIDPVFVILADQSQIVTSAVGNAGQVTIDTQFFLMSPDSQIDTNSQLGTTGTITVTAPKVDVASGVVVVGGGYLTPARLSESCAARSGRGSSSLVGAGRGGLPDTPRVLAERADPPAYLRLARQPSRTCGS